MDLKRRELLGRVVQRRLALRDRAPQILVLGGGRIEAAHEREAHQRADEQRADLEAQRGSRRPFLLGAVRREEADALVVGVGHCGSAAQFRSE